MSIEAYKAAWETDCTGSVKLTLLAIADFASKKNGYSCMASIATLAKMASVSTRQIKRNIATLESNGLIRIDYGQGRSNTNIYSMYALVKGDTHDTLNENIKGDTHDQKVTPMSPFIKEKVTPMTVKGDTHDTLSFTIHNNNKEGDPIQSLSDYFTSIAGVFPSASNYDVNWLAPLKLYFEKCGDLETTKDTIKRAVEFARNGSGTRYTISSPRSIATIIANMPKDGDNKIKVGAI